MIETALTKSDVRQIKVGVYTALILLIVSGTITAGITGYRVMGRLDRIEDKQQRDALRQQANSHAIACVIDSLRLSVWYHSNPGVQPIFSPLATLIPDIPVEEKERVNSHIGNVQLERRP